MKRCMLFAAVMILLALSACGAKTPHRVGDDVKAFSEALVKVTCLESYNENLKILQSHASKDLRDKLPVMLSQLPGVKSVAPAFRALTLEPHGDGYYYTVVYRVPIRSKPYSVIVRGSIVGGQVDTYELQYLYDL